jgi:hypothetical protein
MGLFDRKIHPVVITPPADVIPTEATAWERAAISEIWFAIERAFNEEARRGVAHDFGRLDLAMEIRNILIPPKEPVLRPSVPVVPGRSS